MKEKTISRLREFNRFYLPVFGLLGNSYLGSEYSATEARVLYEIYAADGCTAAAIARNMNIDKSYLSRIIKGHEKKGYLYRTVSANDGRAYHLHMTEEGLQRTEYFIQRSNAEISEKIKDLDMDSCQRLTAALDTITEILRGQ